MSFLDLPPVQAPNFHICAWMQHDCFFQSMWEPDSITLANTEFCQAQGAETDARQKMPFCNVPQTAVLEGDRRC